MHVEIVNVTPGMAEQWLKKNTNNRKVKDHAVKKYAKDLLSGGWSQNHQGIAFDTDGVLADGQHRLLAIIQSGVCVDMVVAWGVSRVGIDRQAPRNEADEIRFSGMSEWIEAKHISVANAMLEVLGAKPKATRTTSEIVSFCEKHKDAIIFSSDCFRKNTALIAPALMKGIVAVASEFEDCERLREFVEIVYSGLPKSQEDYMAVKVRDFLLAGGAKGGQSDRLRAARKIMKAISLFCNKQHMTRMPSPSDLTYKLEV